MRWFDAYPGRLESEFAALKAAGLRFTADTTAREHLGVLKVEVEVELAGGTHTFLAVYPDEFPYFKPVIFGPDLGFTQHSNPTTGEYCVLETGRGAWLPSDTLAWLLTEQLGILGQLNEAGADVDLVRSSEVAQAEPVSCYLEPANIGEYVVVDNGLERHGRDHGFARLVYTSDQPLRGHVVELWDEKMRTISGPVREPRSDLIVSGRHLGAVQIPWVQLLQKPGGTSVNAWWAAAAEVDPRIDQQAVPLPGKHVAVSAALQFVLIGFPEEVAHRALGQGWVLLARDRQRTNKPWGNKRVVRVERAGHLDLFDREPRLRAMSTAKIVLVGLGGLGGQLLPLLACMGPDRLHVVDGDFGAAATAIRNPGAFQASGSPKVQVAVRVANATQPYSDITGLVVKLGQPRANPPVPTRNPLPPDAVSELPDAIVDADLVIDATADLNAQHYLSDVARAHSVAYLRTEALHGVWAGFIALRRPNADVCWMCWQHHLDSMTPLPEQPGGGVQPPGCGDPTYTGAGFDLAAIAAQTARVAVSYLTGADGYGEIPSDVMSVRFRDGGGAILLPAWESHDLGRHPGCKNHP